MSHKFLEPIKIGNVEVKNRVVFMAMAKTMSSFNMRYTARDIAYLKEIAEGGVGIVIPGALHVDPLWPSMMMGAAGLFADWQLPGITEAVNVVHEAGAKILLQLWHPGACDYNGSNPPTINDISVDEIHRIQGMFANAAMNAMKTGADGIEFQMCHTYLANQFLSPLWNHRTDEYGFDTLENRTRFSVETLAMLRQIIGPDKILAVKLQGFDFPEGEGPDGNDGINPDMAAEYAKVIEPFVDMITVSAGGTLTGRDDIMTGDVRRPEGWKVHAAEKVKAAVSIPVAASGNIRHPEFVDQIISEGKCDMVGMARGILAEKNWVKKCEEGREDELRYCISCMNCWNVNPFANNQTNCSVNPYACRETYKRPLEINGDGRVVAIIGAGPAGMEAAVTLKQRGFEPVVFEKENRIGGNVNIAKKPPYKGKFQWQIGYYENMAKKLNIDVRLNTEATVENVLALNPYAILVAAGSDVTAPPIPGLDTVETVQSRDILDKDLAYVNKKMVVIGGGITGMETALYLAEQGNTVSVVDMLPEWPTDMFGGDPRHMMEANLETKHCYEAGVGMYYNNAVVNIADGKVNIKSTVDESETALEVDIVVLSTGVKPNDKLFNELLAAGHPSVWKVGDANVTDKIWKAVMNGSKFAVHLN